EGPAVHTLLVLPGRERARFLRRRDLEREAKRRNLVARMIVRIRQLWKPIELLRLARRTLVDSRIQVDQVEAGRTGRREVDGDIAAAVESARVSHVGVVVRGYVNVVVFGPADALQVNRHRRSGRTRSRRHAD